MVSIGWGDMTTHVLESLIDAAFESRMEIAPGKVPKDLSEALSEILDGLNDFAKSFGAKNSAMSPCSIL